MNKQNLHKEMSPMEYHAKHIQECQSQIWSELVCKMYVYYMKKNLHAHHHSILIRLSRHDNPLV